MKYGSLNLKSDYSLLKSLIKINDLIKYAKTNNINVLSLCDDNLCGSLEFYNACKLNNIKCIIGLEYIYENEEETLKLLKTLNNEELINTKISQSINKKALKSICEIRDGNVYINGILIPDIKIEKQEDKFEIKTNK